MSLCLLCWILVGFVEVCCWYEPYVCIISLLPNPCTLIGARAPRCPVPRWDVLIPGEPRLPTLEGMHVGIQPLCLVGMAAPYCWASLGSLKLLQPLLQSQSGCKLLLRFACLMAWLQAPVSVCWSDGPVASCCYSLFGSWPGRKFMAHIFCLPASLLQARHVRGIMLSCCALLRSRFVLAEIWTYI